jgi:hypothetical protein
MDCRKNKGEAGTHTDLGCTLGTVQVESAGLMPSQCQLLGLPPVRRESVTTYMSLQF